MREEAELWANHPKRTKRRNDLAKPSFYGLLVGLMLLGPAAKEHTSFFHRRRCQNIECGQASKKNMVDVLASKYDRSTCYRIALWGALMASLPGQPSISDRSGRHQSNASICLQDGYTARKWSEKKEDVSWLSPAGWHAKPLGQKQSLHLDTWWREKRPNGTLSCLCTFFLLWK